LAVDSNAHILLLLGQFITVDKVCPSDLTFGQDIAYLYSPQIFSVTSNFKNHHGMKDFRQIFALILLGFIVSITKVYSQEETVTIKNTIGSAKEVYQVKDKISNVRQGPYFYKYGKKMQIKGEYLNDCKHGYWQYIYDNNFKINAFFNKGEKDSIWTYYSGNSIISEIHYKNGKRNGLAVGYYNQGTKQSIIPYKYGRIDGIRKAFYMNGNIKYEVGYRNDTINGDLKYFDINGKTILYIIYKNNHPFSIEIIDLPDSIRYYSGDLKNGTGSINIYSKKIKTDSLFLISQQQYLDGFLDGKCTEYQYDGKLYFTGNYKHNCMVGLWNLFNPNNPKVYKSKLYSLKDSIQKDSTESYRIVNTKIASIFKQTLPKFLSNEANEFRVFIGKSLKYPESAAEKGITGRVMIQFDIDETGNLLNIKPLNSIFDDLRKEALRVMETSPNWIPGFEENIPCKVRFTFPITFDLQ
jgi:TonB family protein